MRLRHIRDSAIQHCRIRDSVIRLHHIRGTIIRDSIIRDSIIRDSVIQDSATQLRHFRDSPCCRCTWTRRNSCVPPPTHQFLDQGFRHPTYHLTSSVNS